MVHVAREHRREEPWPVGEPEEDPRAARMDAGRRRRTRTRATQLEDPMNEGVRHDADF